MSFRSWRVRLLQTAAFCGVLTLLSIQTSGGRMQAQSACGPTVNPIVCENLNPGNPASERDISGSGGASIQGFPTNISVAPGQSVSLKIKTTASAYSINI